MIVNWSRKSLKSISSQICSGGTPLVSEKSFYGGDIPWLRTQEIQGAIVWDTEVKITKKGLENSAAKWVAKNSIALAMYGNTAGRVSTVGIDYTSNQACCNLTINPSLADYRFVYYSLLNDYQKLHDLSSGAAQRNLNAGLVRGYEILIPDSVLVQTKIADVLWNLDRKIALNRKKIAALEKMSKEIYDYWFVQYDFPDANGRPYKSSGGEMVYSPELKREIPKGWKVEQLGGHLSQVEERVQSVGDDEDFYAPIEVLPRKEMSFSIGAPIENAVSGLCRFRARDILISNRRVYFHKVCVAPRNGLTRDTVFVIRPKKSMSLAEMYQRVNSDEFISYATQSSYGSLQPVLPFGTIKTYRYAQPPEALSVAYNGIANPIVENVLALHLDTDRLSTLRDWLLPLLMNGQVKVGE